MLHFGIPAYRLPRDELMKEIGRIERMGVKFVPDHRVDDVLAEQKQRFRRGLYRDRRHLSKHVDIPARDAIKVLDAVSLLRDGRSRPAPRLGGAWSSTAVETRNGRRRTVRRLGVADHDRLPPDREHMPAHDSRRRGLDEGVKIKWLTSIKAIDGTDLTVEVMRIDESGHAQPTGQLKTLKADTLVLALGQDATAASSRKFPKLPLIAMVPSSLRRT